MVAASAFARILRLALELEQLLAEEAKRDEDNQLAVSPFPKNLHKDNLDVLYLVGHIDEHGVRQWKEFDGRKQKDTTKDVQALEQNLGDATARELGKQLAEEHVPKEPLGGKEIARETQHGIAPESPVTEAMASDEKDNNTPKKPTEFYIWEEQTSELELRIAELKQAAEIEGLDEETSIFLKKTI